MSESERLGASGNQARLNNGCVCDSGCAQCGALAKSWEALRGCLSALATAVSMEGLTRNPAWAELHKECRAALTLAAKVKA